MEVLIQEGLPFRFCSVKEKQHGRKYIQVKIQTSEKLVRSKQIFDLFRFGICLVLILVGRSLGACKVFGDLYNQEKFPVFNQRAKIPMSITNIIAMLFFLQLFYKFRMKLPLIVTMLAIISEACTSLVVNEFTSSVFRLTWIVFNAICLPYS